MRILTPLLIVFLASSALAAEPKVNRDIAYAGTKNERQMLDIYGPAEGKNLPIVIWIHGGGWQGAIATPRQSTTGGGDIGQRVSGRGEESHHD